MSTELTVVDKQENDINLLFSEFANLFKIYSDTDSNAIFNVLRTLHIQGVENMAEKYINKYIVKQSDTWTLISYKLYNDVKLWWIICKFNGVQNPYTFPTPGAVIYYPTNDMVSTILKLLGESK